MPDQFVTTITTDNTGRWIVPDGVELLIYGTRTITVPAYEGPYVTVPEAGESDEPAGGGEDASAETVDPVALTDRSPDESHTDEKPRIVIVDDERHDSRLRPRRESGSDNMDLLTRDLTTRLDTGADVERLLADLSLPVPVIASTQGVKDDGFDLRMSDWDLERYKRYSPILNNHSWWEPTLGRGANLRFDEQGSLRADSYFDRQDPFAVLQRGKLIQEMAAISVGWRTIERGERQQNQLYEYSVVSMPMDIDAQAIFDGRSAEYAIAIRGMADVETVRAWQMRANNRDLGQLEEAKEANRLLRDATPEEIAAWLEGAAWDQLDIIRSTWDQLLLERSEQEAEEADRRAAEEAEVEEVLEEENDQYEVDWSRVLAELDRFSAS